MPSKNPIKSNRTFVIAEAGVNHNGDIEIAKKLIDAAKSAGADAVKFQNFKAKRVISKHAAKANYQKKGKQDHESQLAMLLKLELKDSDYKKLKAYTQKKKILFLSTPKDIPSAKLLESIGMPLYKIGSSEVNNFDFLRFIAQTGKPIILSTGMCTLGEVEDAVKVIQEKSKAQLYLLHCVSQYPCSPKEINLRSMLTMAEAFKVPVGYSDHTIGSDVILAAVSLGAIIIEKHFTIDKNLEGPDQKVSMETSEMKCMIKSIRVIESCMGDGIKKPAPCEIQNRELLRRSLAFSKNLPKGSKINDSDLTIKRPGFGLEPKFKPVVLKRVLKKSVNQDQPVTWESFL